MNDLKIGICEDDETQRKYIISVLEAYFKDRHMIVEMEAFESSEELLFKYPESLPFSCILLDIKMKEINGMELAKRIRKADKNIHIIFITGDRDYALEGYKVGAVRYLLKPYREEDLIEALECVDEKVQKEKKEEYYCLNYMGEFVRIKLSDIFSVEVQGHYLSIKTGEKEYSYKESMKNIRTGLPEDRFIPASRSALVNLQKVERITRKECILSNGSVISVSRSCYDPLNMAFVKYYRHKK